MKIRRKQHADRRERETKSAKCKPFLLAQIVGYGPSGGATRDASYQRAACGPAYARRVQTKQLA